MAERIQGTPAITGLNQSTASHLIEDSELVESVDGFTEKDGQWNVAPRPELLYSGADIIAYEAGRMGGADHHVWIDGSTLYDNGASVGTVPDIGDEMEIKAIDDVFLILGAAKNQIWDGTHLREQGSWDVTNHLNTGFTVIDALTYDISGATRASPCRLTLPSGHGASVGKYVYIEGVEGMTELNGNYYKVLTKGTTYIDIDVNSTLYGVYNSGSASETITSVLRGGSDGSAFSGVQSVSAGYTVLNVSGTNNIRTGQTVEISGVGGMIELNGTVSKVVSHTSTYIVIDLDSRSFAGVYTSGGTVQSVTTSGTVYVDACGLTGAYKFYMVGTVELASGRVITGKPYALGGNSFVTGYKYEEIDPVVYQLTPYKDLRFNARVTWLDAVGDAVYEIDGVAGVDYFPGLRLYRTKRDGYDAYLEKEWRHGDPDFSLSSPSPGNAYQVDQYSVRVPDRDLGAVLPYGFQDRTSPPASDFAAFSSQRLFVADGKFLHWSAFDGLEYYTPTGATLMWDTITALGSYQDYCIVFSADRMWAVRVINGLPDIEEIDTAVGTTYPKAVLQTDAGLMFLRDDGLWLFNGGPPTKISRKAFSSITNPQSVMQAGELLYVSGSDKAYIALNRGQSQIWHDSSYVYPYASSTSGVPYAAGAFNVNQMFIGIRDGGSFRTKLWGGFDASMRTKFELDMEGDSLPDLVIDGNISSDSEWHSETTPASFEGRRIIWTYLPRILSDYVDVEVRFTGDITAFGYRVTEER